MGKLSKHINLFERIKKNAKKNLFSCLSKILERTIIYNYLNGKNLLFQKQFGFRNGHSTVHALIKLVYSKYGSFNQNKYALGVFIDLSKAFDTVDHNILIDKLNSYGIKNNSPKWFSSYLSNRKHFIQASAMKTSSLDILKINKTYLKLKFIFDFTINYIPDNERLD